VITDVCGYNTLDFGDVLDRPGGTTASREAVSGMLNNITIDGSWIMSTAQLSKLITLEGGITVDVTTNVVQQTGGGGGRILVPSGTQKLTGDQAVEYATYIASVKEDATAQLPRLQQVIDATAMALPRTPTAVAALVRQLGVSGESSLGATKLSNFLVGFATAERGTGTLFPTDLPSNAIDAGGAPSYRVDASGANNLVKNYFTSSLPSDAGTPRPTVELLNGVGSPGLVATTCPKLAAHRLTYVGSTNAATFNHPTSQVLVANSDISLGYTVADALGLPHSDVRRTTIDQTIANAIVTLGNDYKP
jgi:anionic cell wall polymer biosynthesis LytR-Cps2A-Psr (LCP) family protein